MKVGKAPSPPSNPPIPTEDEEGSASTGTGTFVKDSSSNDNNLARAYLFRYETMARQQQAEDMATLAHLTPCICRLMELLGMEVNLEEFNEASFLFTEVSFEQLRLAFDILRQQQPREPMTTDRQLMMVFDMLTQKVDLKQPEQNASSPFVTWAEIVQCYKICVSGMVTLQHLQQHPTHRARARDRTLAMLSLFEPPSTQLFHEDSLSVRSSSTVTAALEEPVYTPRSGMKRRSLRKQKSVVGSVSKGIGLCLAAAWLWSSSRQCRDPSRILNIALTQQGVPSHTDLEQQRNVTECLVSAASKAAAVSGNSTNISKQDCSESETAPRAELSSSALLPHAPISQAIGDLFCYLAAQARQRIGRNTR